MIELVVVAVCLCLNALLSCLGMAFVSVGRPQLRQMAQRGHKDAQRLLRLRDNPERTLSILQIGITLVGALSDRFGIDRAVLLLPAVAMLGGAIVMFAGT